MIFLWKEIMISLLIGVGLLLLVVIGVWSLKWTHSVSLNIVMSLAGWLLPLCGDMTSKFLEDDFGFVSKEFMDWYHKWGKFLPLDHTEQGVFLILDILFLFRTFFRKWDILELTSVFITMTSLMVSVWLCHKVQIWLSSLRPSAWSEIGWMVMLSILILLWAAFPDLYELDEIMGL